MLFSDAWETEAGKLQDENWNFPILEYLIEKIETCKCLYICVRVYMCVCMFILCPLLFSFRISRTRALSSKYNFNLADFKDLMFLLRSNLIEKIKRSPEALSTNT